MLIVDEMDVCLDLRPPNIRSIIDANPRVSTWSGHDPPLGYLDWWPVCLGFNNLHAIDREQVVKVGWQGAGTYSLLPFPDYPPIRRYTDQIQA